MSPFPSTPCRQSGSLKHRSHHVTPPLKTLPCFPLHLRFHSLWAGAQGCLSPPIPPHALASATLNYLLGPELHSMFPALSLRSCLPAGWNTLPALWKPSFAFSPLESYYSNWCLYQHMGISWELVTSAGSRVSIAQAPRGCGCAHGLCSMVVKCRGCGAAQSWFSSGLCSSGLVILDGLLILF